RAASPLSDQGQLESRDHGLDLRCPGPRSNLLRERRDLYVHLQLHRQSEPDCQDGLGLESLGLYGRFRRLITDVAPPSGVGGPTHTDYYSDGSVMQSTDEVGVKTFYAAYNPNGTPTQITLDYQGPLAVRFDYTYDPNFLEKVTSITPKDPSTGQVNPDW